jgi:hypothetical protein
MNIQSRLTIRRLGQLSSGPFQAISLSLRPALHPLPEQIGRTRKLFRQIRPIPTTCAPCPEKKGYL